MLLAAGRGERLRPLTDLTPKPLLEVRGKPLIVWHLEALARAGVRDVVINLSWLGARIRAAVGEGGRFGLTIHYSDEPAAPLEAGGGIFQALPLLGAAPFLVVNSDTYTDIDFTRLTIAPAALAQLVLVPNPEHHPRGDFALQNGEVLETGETRYTYAGIGVYRPELFAGCAAGRFPLLPVLRRAIAARRLRGELFGGQWVDVGSAERLAALNAGATGL
ncbi:MAG TPA: nucleotidyltransferase family protein [Steroidobacteraceae bacterium]|nr:nucleotidyltransferase family protein [Steroidobacteraceae bacterium]